IYAKALPPDTTSNIAGGQWLPSWVYSGHADLSPRFTQQYVAACRFAYQRYQVMTDPRYGVRWMRNYLIQRIPFAPDTFAAPEGEPTVETATRGLQPEARVLGPAENPWSGFYAAQFDGMIVETPIYLEAMLNEFRLMGGTVVVRELKDISEVRAL